MYIPNQWLNINAVLPELFEPLLDPSSGAPVNSGALEDLFPQRLIEQEFDVTNKFIPIPEDILLKYRNWRPTPLIRARNLEALLQTKCKIFFKYEGSSPIGSHKANSGVAQAYFAKEAGKKKLFAETGAGQWGSAVSMASAFYGLDSEVFMVGNSYDAKSGRRTLMQTFGGKVHRSPTKLTSIGCAELADSPGSLGLAISEAMEATRANKNAAYAIGSAFGFVCLHQTIIGQELKSQLQTLDLKVDALISCVGGGSSFAGLVFPFVEDVMDGKKIDLIAVESTSTPKITKGEFTYDYGDSAKKTPLIKMYTVGSGFASPDSHSGGLRYHGLSSQVSKLINLGLASAEAYSQLEIFDAAKTFAQCEGLIPAPESAHSIASTIAYATKHKDEEKTIVFCLTGHGFFDLAGYEKYNRGEMKDSEPSSSQIKSSLSTIGTRNEIKQTNTFSVWKNIHFKTSETSATSTPVGNRSPADLSVHRLIAERHIVNLDNNSEIKINTSAVITPGANNLIKEKSIIVKR